MIITKNTARRYDICIKTKGLNECFVCKKNFNYDEYPFLELVRNHNNVFICKECAKKILEESK